MTTQSLTRDLSPATVRAMIEDHSILLIDVREPHAHTAERIAGALLMPLSSFDPASLPPGEGRDVVFHCGSGKRSAMAISRCLESGLDDDAHLEGGIQAWRLAGFPIVSADRAGAAGAGGT